MPEKNAKNRRKSPYNSNFSRRQAKETPVLTKSYGGYSVSERPLPANHSYYFACPDCGRVYLSGPCLPITARKARTWRRK